MQTDRMDQFPKSQKACKEKGSARKRKKKKKRKGDDQVHGLYYPSSSVMDLIRQGWMDGISIRLTYLGGARKGGSEKGKGKEGRGMTGPGRLYDGNY